jgi:hypothetical protein
MHRQEVYEEIQRANQEALTKGRPAVPKITSEKQAPPPRTPRFPSEKRKMKRCWPILAKVEFINNPISQFHAGNFSRGPSEEITPTAAFRLGSIEEQLSKAKDDTSCG